MKKLNWVTLGIVLTVLLSFSISGCASKEQLSDAYNEGYQVGYNEAYTPAYEEGYTVGYEEGHTIGYDEGYSEGYNLGSAEMRRTLEATIQALRERLSVIQEKDGQSQKPTSGDMFFFYYTHLEEQQYGVEKLEKCLDRTWKEELYKANVFDCSEMSAFLEWYLENEGWHTEIETGKSPDGSGEKHAWLLVETSEGKYMPVEATQWAIVYWDNPYFENYFDYALRGFETIQEAIAYNATEFDWWVSL